MDPHTGERSKMALKKLNMVHEKEGFPITALREIKFLQSLNHENIVKLHNVLHSKCNISQINLNNLASKRNKFRGSYYLVFEYLKHDLQGLIDKKV